MVCLSPLPISIHFPFRDGIGNFSFAVDQRASIQAAATWMDADPRRRWITQGHHSQEEERKEKEEEKEESEKDR